MKVTDPVFEVPRAVPRTLRLWVLAMARTRRSFKYPSSVSDSQPCLEHARRALSNSRFTWRLAVCMSIRMRPNSGDALLRTPPFGSKTASISFTISVFSLTVPSMLQSRGKARSRPCKAAMMSLTSRVHCRIRMKPASVKADPETSSSLISALISSKTSAGNACPSTRIRRSSSVLSSASRMVGRWAVGTRSLARRLALSVLQNSSSSARISR